MRKLRIELQLSKDISIHILLQKITDLMPEISDIGSIVNLELITTNDLYEQKPFTEEDYNVDSTESDSIDRKYEGK